MFYMSDEPCTETQPQQAQRDRGSGHFKYGGLHLNRIYIDIYICIYAYSLFIYPSVQYYFFKHFVSTGCGAKMAKKL